jgi:hypothetical protein
VFGTAKGQDGEDAAGQACRKRINTFLVLPGSELPYHVALPSTSLKPFGEYVVRMRQAKKSLRGFVTRMILRPDRSKSGVEYTACEYQSGEEIPYTEMVRIKKIYDAMLEAMMKRGAQVAAEDVAAEGKPQEEDEVPF